MGIDGWVGEGRSLGYWGMRAGIVHSLYKVLWDILISA